MKRRMVFLEASMYAGADTPVNVVFPVKVEGFFEESAVRNALQKIQQKHPFLRVTIETGTDGIPSYVTQELIEPIPYRMIERQSDDDWLAEAEVEWSTPFNANNTPLARLVWLRSEQVSELLIVCHHCIGDATSIITLMRELLECLAEPGTTLHPYAPFCPEALVPAEMRQSQLNRLAGRSLAVVTRLFLWG